MTEEIERLKLEIEQLKKENEALKKRETAYREHKLTNTELQRYSRHLLLPEIGVKGQEKLLKGSVLLVGAGGLGSPAALYLAAAGVGTIGLVDFDVVDESNLQRQIMHDHINEGISKVVSARQAIKRLNPNVKVDQYETDFNITNGIELVSKYDVIIDCSDNVATRYLVNDACVMAGKPLVSGSAVKMDGQLTIYNAWIEEGKRGPCYRCLFPDPPPPQTVTNCSDGGVLGVVPGILGCLQALEAQKIIMGYKPTQLLVGRMLLFNARNTTFRTAKLRGKQSTCAVCGQNPKIVTLSAYENPPCGIRPTINEAYCMEPQEFNQKHYNKVLGNLRDQPLQKSPLIDVRVPIQFEIGSIHGAQNLPLASFNKNIDTWKQLAEEHDTLYLYCRRGVASIKTTNKLVDMGITNVKNINGGINAWKEDIDPTFPTY